MFDKFFSVIPNVQRLGSELAIIIFIIDQLLKFSPNAIINVIIAEFTFNIPPS